jgi:thiamine-monophosphate kinase
MEADFLQWLRGRLPASPACPLGLSDDAAWLQLPAAGQLPGAGQLLATVDLLTDGVDFELAENVRGTQADPRRVGRKALAVNLSDLAAMAARPLAALVALALPRSGAARLARELYEGLLPLAEKYEVAIAGGDTNTWDGPLAISVTLLGTPGPAGPLTRRGARPGDQILVTGSFGGSLLGKHFDFEPRVAEALELAGRYQLRAGIDVSDGLSLDLARVAAESGCGAIVELDSIPLAPAAHELARQQADGRTPLDHALEDGEDFELILAAAPDAASRILQEQPLAIPITRIGQFVAEPGLWQTAAGGRRPLAARGYEHRAEP